jgi:hypothetical protein
MPFLAAIPPAVMAVSAAVSAAAGIAGTVMSVQGANAQAKAAKIQNQADIQASEQAAQAAEYDAEQRLTNAEGERAAVEKQNQRAISKRRAINAATGTATEGSSLAVLLDQIGEAEMEELNIMRGAEQFAGIKKYEAKASRARIPGQIAAGRYQASAGRANATASAIGGVSSVLGSMASYGRMGAFKS